MTLAGGEELRAPLVVSGLHPKSTVLDLVGGSHFPDEVVEDMRRYRTRGGSVKINCVLSELPRYVGVSDEEQELLLHTGISFCPSIDYLERAWQDAARGVPAEAPYVEMEVPSAVDPTLTADEIQPGVAMDVVQPLLPDATTVAMPMARSESMIGL